MQNVAAMYVKKLFIFAEDPISWILTEICYSNLSMHSVVLQTVLKRSVGSLYRVCQSKYKDHAQHNDPH